MFAVMIAVDARAEKRREAVDAFHRLQNDGVDRDREFASCVPAAAPQSARICHPFSYWPRRHTETEKGGEPGMHTD